MSPFDLQINGYRGTDFNSHDLNGDALHEACEALRRDGAGGILATLITDHLERLEAKIRRLVSLREADPLARDMIQGLHIEGPFISPESGYVGAHPVDAVCPATPDAMHPLLDAGAGLVRLVTLAPEHDAGLATTRKLVEAGVTVSAGHCDPSHEQLEAAIDVGLSMITHLGNGCPVTLARHDNFIQRVLSLSDRLWIGFIPDGAHVEFFALHNYLDICGTDRAIMTTDAIAAAGLAPGRHSLSGFEVEVDEEGVCRRPGSPNLAGSSLTVDRLPGKLREGLGLTPEEIESVWARNPRAALGLPLPE